MSLGKLLRCCFLLALIAAPARAQVRHEFGVMMPMRDGVRLAADIWFPEAPGRYPVLLARTPYMRSGLRLADWGRYFASRGYAFVAQDTRGRGDSEGEFEFFAGDGRDGHDSIEWLATRPWSNGRIGTLGLSYLGTVQWLAAREHPPGLRCMAPTAAAGRWLDELPWQGGAFSLEFALDWLSRNAGRIPQGNVDSVDWQKVYAHRPLLTADSVLGRLMPIYRTWLENPTASPYWKRITFSAQDFAGIDIPTLTTTGWYDADQPGALFYWRGLMANAPQRDRHYLIVGPWEHVETFQGGVVKVGDSQFTPESIVDNKAIHAEFFDWCLKGTSPRFDARRARVYVTGANVWRSFDAYPPESATPRRLYLTSGGNANTLRGDGRLVWAPIESPPDRYTFDPKHPVPGSIAEQGRDRQVIQQRQDVLVYSSEALTQPVEIIGQVNVSLRAASDAMDTDFTAVLSDVGPDGRALKLGMVVAIRRARYRNGYEKEELLRPGTPATIPLELFDIAHRFQPGHRIRLEISSSSSPNYNPNQNTGNPVATDTLWRIARQTIYHDRTRRSWIELPVVTAPPIP